MKKKNLTNLLASNSINVAGNIDNQTVKEDIDFTNADFEGTLSIPIDLLSKSGRVKVKDAFENFPENLGKTLDVTALEPHVEGRISSIGL